MRFIIISLTPIPTPNAHGRRARFASGRRRRAVAMLYADKRALENNLQVSLIRIREKELDFYAKNCTAIGTQAALLSGFAYSSILGMSFSDDVPIGLQLLYTAITAIAMTVELIALFNSTLCAMLGPGLALRGPDGSMHTAVDGMTIEYRICFLFFVLGVLAFFMSALLYAWISFHWPIALSTSLVLVFFCVRSGSHAKRIFLKFELKAEYAVDGRMLEDDLGPPVPGGGGSGHRSQEASRVISARWSPGAAAGGRPAGARGHRDDT
eukprot:CAMPEP_0179885532 /NCGR_PEP_ID=MMETSP0982-20121206/30334_1 /TAXON_ID=483367 /ORGANISM="non described non described, Strain CCMP 2436" /LENGTH=266 /DNA_ID=CAMNT_0021781125 /DNA_START=472 /DNA_END=1269 /DNA_ORIENTATION=+